MPKAKPKEEAATGFSALSADDNQWIRSLEDAGWRFEFDKAAGWTANKDGIVDESGNEVFGPFDAFTMMMNMVERAEKRSQGLTAVEETSKGRKLPGAHEYSNAELDELSARRGEAVAAFKLAQKKISTINEECLNAYSSHPEHFVLNEATGKHEYVSPDGHGIRIRHDTVDKVESFTEQEAKPSKSKKKDK